MDLTKPDSSGVDVLDPVNIITISVGSNSDREHNIRCAVQRLKSHFSPLSISTVFESESVGFSGDPFYNFVVMGKTTLGVAETVALLKSIEDELGRDRSAPKFSGRTIDLDLLNYNDQVCEQPVTLPRAEILYNAFVLRPLAEILPEAIHPLEKKSYQQLWAEYDKSQQKLWPITFDW